LGLLSHVLTTSTVRDNL